MKEKELIKQAIEQSLMNKDSIRCRVMASIQDQAKSAVTGGIFMNKRFAVAMVVLLVVAVVSVSGYAVVDNYKYNQASQFLNSVGVEVDALSRSVTKKVYKDIKTESFAYEGTYDVLKTTAVNIGIENVPSDASAIYDLILGELVPTARITSDQIRQITADMTYRTIVDLLGETKDIGSGLHVLQYTVDGDKILLLSYATDSDVCARSGEDLLASLQDGNQNTGDPNTFNATLRQRDGNRILVDCPTYDKFDTISLGITEETVIVFENGDPATIDDITFKLTITIADQIRESYPPQGTALKIVVKK